MDDIQKTINDLVKTVEKLENDVSLLEKRLDMTCDSIKDLALYIQERQKTWEKHKD